MRKKGFKPLNTITVWVLKRVMTEKSNVVGPLARVSWCERLEFFPQFSPSSSFAKLPGCMPENLFSPNSPI
jgi:hypothetical protein